VPRLDARDEDAGVVDGEEEEGEREAGEQAIAAGAEEAQEEERRDQTQRREDAEHERPGHDADSQMSPKTSVPSATSDTTLRTTERSIDVGKTTRSMNVSTLLQASPPKQMLLQKSRRVRLSR